MQPNNIEYPANVFMMRGVIVDYLIRYVANGNKLDFMHTIAFEGQNAFSGSQWAIYTHWSCIIFAMGKCFLDGRAATSREAVFSATALAILDGYYRSERLPFEMPYCHDTVESCEQYLFTDDESKIIEIARWMIDGVINCRGEEDFYEDIINVVNIFNEAFCTSSGQLFGSRFIEKVPLLNNGNLLGGADFDCLIHHKNKKVLTEIKTTRSKTTAQNLRQLIGYALLADPKKDELIFDSIGYYHSRAGSFRTMNIEDVIRAGFNDFATIEEARNEFITTISGGKAQ